MRNPFRYSLVQHMAFIQISHETAVSFAKTDQHFFFLMHVAARQSGLAAVAPARPCQRLPQGLGLDLADALQVLHQCVLLGIDLHGRLQVLQGATTTLAKMRATRRHAMWRRLQYFQGLPFVKAALPVRQTSQNPLSRKRAMHKDFLLPQCRHTPAVMAEILDKQLNRLPRQLAPPAPAHGRL